MSENTDAFDEAWGDIAARLRDINRTLMISPASVRYDVQRNLVEVVEELSRHQPINPEILESLREVAEGMIEGYKGRGRVHVGLRRIADQQSAPPETDTPSKIKPFSSLRAVFSQNAKTDSYLLDSQLARRDADGEIVLSPWGQFVLDYMDYKADEARQSHVEAGMNQQFHQPGDDVAP